MTFAPDILKLLNNTAYSIMIYDNTPLHNLLPLNGQSLAVVPLPALMQPPPAIAATATQSPFTITIQGTGLDQVVQVTLRRSGAADVASTSVVVTSTTGVANFPASNLAAGSYELVLVTDKTTPITIDSGKALVLN